MTRNVSSNHVQSRGAGRSMRRIVVSFIIAVGAVGALILYYALARASIVLEVGPDSEIMETLVTVNQYNQGDDVTGTIVETEVTQNQKYLASPSGELEEKASGKVKIVSTHSAPQTLIATTRLLSPAGVLFRITETVTVPANGSVEVPAMADQAGEASAIGPTKFTIPGLRQALQDKIYAESSEPMQRQPKAGAQVTLQDLERARKELTDLVGQQAISKLREQLPPEQRELSVVYRTQNLKAESDVPAGTKRSDFTYTVTEKVTGIFYDSASLRERALEQLQADLTTGRKILTLEPESLAVSIESIASDLTSATLRVKFLAQVIITDPEVVFRKTDLLGRTEEEVKNYFSSIKGVKSVEVKLSPFWVTAVPTVESHIELNIKE